MKLSYNSIKQNKDAFRKKMYDLPEYDIEKVNTETYKNPKWIHFGAGNIFRAFQCALQQDLLNNHYVDYGIIVAEGYDYEIIDKAFTPYDNLTLLATLKVDGTINKKILASISESLKISQDEKEDFLRLKEIFKSASLQMVSFTITEKGYATRNKDNEFYPEIYEDTQNDIEEANSYLGKLVSLLYTRFCNGAHPLALVSMDNMAHNGDFLKSAVLDLANSWNIEENDKNKFVKYLKDETCITFPVSMIDKITPRPDEKVMSILEEDGIDDIRPVITGKGTYVAPFVNAEEAQYLVVEDKFPNGRPPLEKAGVIFTSRETVDMVEKMKVTTCLNPLHTALAIFGCLLGYDKISNEMKDKDLLKFISNMAYKEAMPVVPNPKIINPQDFLNEVLTIRLPNTFMPDTPQRIATDTSQKISIRFLETVKSYIQSENLDVNALEYIPCTIAGWIRYLMGIDDNGNIFTLSDDPLLDELAPIVSGLSLGSTQNVSIVTKEVLSMRSIFPIDLYETKLAEKVESYLSAMLVGKGAVRSVIEKLNNERQL